MSMTQTHRLSIGIDRKLADELKEYVINKYGFFKGVMRSEMEIALRNHIRGDKKTEPKATGGKQRRRT